MINMVTSSDIRVHAVGLVTTNPLSRHEIVSVRTRSLSRQQFASFGLTSHQLWRGDVGNLKERGVAFFHAENLKESGVSLGKRPRRFQKLKVAEDSFDTSNVALEEQKQQLSSEEEQDLEDISEILRVVELLRKKRDMTFNEVRLTIMIEDPREVERRAQLGIEDDRGCSREELAAALLEVYEGRIPQDRIVLRELAKEMLNWPNLEEEISAGRLPPVASPYAKVTDTGVDPRLAAERAKVDWDTAADITPGEGKKDLGETLPPVVGYSFLYLVSSIPIIIGVAVVLILFVNSLQ